MVKYYALPIKNWIINKISPFGYSMLISRCLPELLEANPKFTSVYISKKTKWSETEFHVIQYYLSDLYDIDLPSELIAYSSQLQVDYSELLKINFFNTRHVRTSISQILNRIFN